MHRWIVALLMATSSAALGYQGPAGASVGGQVVNQTTGTPLKDAVVRLGTLVQQTDDEGRFLFVEVNHGNWPLSADKPGFTTGFYGARKYLPQGSLLTVKENQQINDLVLKLTPQAAIAGRVLNVDGEPMEGAHVAVLKARYIDGVRRWSEVASATTLDNGTYRVPRVAVGQYLVRCTIARIDRPPSSSGNEKAYATTYYPNTMDQSLAAPLDVPDGSEISGIDIRLTPTRVFHVRGRYQPPNGRQVDGYGYVALIDKTDRAKVFTSSSALPPEYRIDMSRIPPGSYIAYAWTWAGGTRIATQPVEVRDRDVDNLLLIPTGTEITGSLKLKPDGAQLDIRRLLLDIRPIELDTSSAHYNSGDVKIGEDLKFRWPIPYQPLFASFAVELPKLPEGSYIASIQYGGITVPESGIEYANDAALEITIGTDSARVDGVTRDKEGKAFGGAVVALIPAEGRSARRFSISGSQGAFQFTGVLPGKYKLLAWDDVARDDVENPDFLKRFESEVSAVELSSGGSVNVSLVVNVTGIAR